MGYVSWGGSLRGKRTVRSKALNMKGYPNQHRDASGYYREGVPEERGILGARSDLTPTKGLSSSVMQEVVPEEATDTVTVEDVYCSVGKLVAAAVSSANIKELCVERKNGKRKVRPQFHVIIRADTGQLKSTFMKKVAEDLGVDIYQELTIPGLVGTVDKNTGELIVGAAWEVANKVLLLDEFTPNYRGEYLKSFLVLLEDQWCTKKIGLRSAGISKRKGDLRLTVKDGHLTFRTRFSCIISTMIPFEATKGQFVRALMNRCAVYEYNLSPEQLDRVALEEPEFTYPRYHPAEIVTIGRKEYREIVNFVAKVMLQCPVASWVKAQNRLRAIDDIIRFRAATGHKDPEFEAKIVWWKLKAYAKIGSNTRKKAS